MQSEQRNDEPKPILRIWLGHQGILKIEGQLPEQGQPESGFAFAAQILPAILRLHKAAQSA